MATSQVGPIVLVNPPSPKGRIVNREGFGGLGVVTPDTKGFVYPAHRLAEAAGLLRSREREILGLDFVLDPGKAPKIWKKCDRISGAIIHVSVQTLLHDLNIARTFQRAAGGAPVAITGVGLESHRDMLDEMCPGVFVDIGPTGYPAALHVLEIEGALETPDLWPDACWETMPLGKSRWLPMYHGRGCTHLCDYCPYVVATGREHLSRSVARTLREFRDQVSLHRPKRVVFRDPVFGLQHAGTLELLEQIAALPKRQRAPFEVETRPELIDEEILDALKAAGCVELKLGIETLEEEPLLQTRRVADRGEAKRYLDAVDAALRGAVSRGLCPHPFLMSGLPGSSADGEKRARRYARGFADPAVKKTVYPGEGAPRILG
ncbi:MAG: hypothetical protein CL908_09055 [Deltaproteobacteria bacterium]|nr:hypothetical protein [Deltaproteobacteria bacterium]